MIRRLIAIFLLLLSTITCQSQAHISFYAHAEADNKPPVLLLGDCHIAGDPSEAHRVIMKNFIENISLSSTPTTLYLEAMPTARYKVQPGKTLLGVCAFANDNNGQVGSVDFVYADVRPKQAMLLVRFFIEYFESGRICTIGQPCSSLEQLSLWLQKNNGWEDYGNLLKNDVQGSAFSQLAYSTVISSIEESLDSIKDEINVHSSKSRFLKSLYADVLNELALFKATWGLSDKPFVDVIWQLACKSRSFDQVAQFQEQFIVLIAHLADLGFTLKFLKAQCGSNPSIFFGGQFHAEQLVDLLEEQGYTVTINCQTESFAPITEERLNEYLDSYYSNHAAGEVQKAKNPLFALWAYIRNQVVGWIEAVMQLFA